MKKRPPACTRDRHNIRIGSRRGGRLLNRRGINSMRLAIAQNRFTIHIPADQTNAGQRKSAFQLGQILRDVIWTPTIPFELCSDTRQRILPGPNINHLHVIHDPVPASKNPLSRINVLREICQSRATLSATPPRNKLQVSPAPKRDLRSRSTNPQCLFSPGVFGERFRPISDENTCPALCFRGAAGELRFAAAEHRFLSEWNQNHAPCPHTLLFHGNGGWWNFRGNHHRCQRKNSPGFYRPSTRNQNVRSDLSDGLPRPMAERTGAE